MPKKSEPSKYSQRRPVNGRPCKLTPEVQERLLTAIRQGLKYDTACALAGITYHTMRNWMIAGESTKDGIYFNFFTALKKAEAEAEEELIKSIRNAGHREWQANAWILERRYPERWARRERSENVTINVDLDQLTDDQLTRIANGESVSIVLGDQG